MQGDPSILQQALAAIDLNTAIPMSIFGLFVALPTLYAFYVGPYSYFRRSKEIQD